ncbi:hypothetical protein WME90_35090 [Sorangium sp. So ce375]|uniref:hypothetical protein n=1 Tax=Sorangium sp. So ce375 TaxID=3133306 RepID=UPI003F5B7363
MNKFARLTAVSLALAATVVPWSDLRAQTSGVTIAPVAQFLNATQILIQGTVPCSQIGASVNLMMSVAQNINGPNGVTGTGFPGITCTVIGPQPFSAVVSTPFFDGTTFHTGKAYVVAEGFETFCNPGCNSFALFGSADVQVKK